MNTPINAADRVLNADELRAIAVKLELMNDYNWRSN